MKTRLTSIAFLLSSIALANNVQSTVHTFAVEPTPAQKLQEAITESSDFLSQIDIVYDIQQSGTIISLQSELIGSRTNTDDKDRKTKDPHKLTSREYKCRQVDYDHHVKYTTLDKWRHKPEFVLLFNAAVVKAIARTRIAAAFNGTKWADDTDFSKNPLMQDLARGWLQAMREENAARVMTSVKVGKGQEYANIDALVYDAVGEFIHEEYQDSPELVAIVGRKVLKDKYFPIINQAGNQATELASASDLIASEKTVGGLKAIRVPFFPSDCILITPLKNLRLYIQTETERRSVVDNPKRNQVETYQSENIDFQIATLEAAAMIEGIVFEDVITAGQGD